MTAVQMSSSMSLRGFQRLGSRASLFDFLGLGSSVSVRHFVRLGSTLSVYNAASDGSTTQVRVGGAMLTHTHRTTGAAGDPQIQIYADAEHDPSVSLWAANTGSSQYGGTLHGTWTSQGTVTVSDRRLKTSVLPLGQALLATVDRNSASLDGSSPTVRSVIEGIRPVAFRYKHAAESKFSRFGFIAQELEGVLPNLVFQDGHSGMKAVSYTDLVAVLAVGLQTTDQRVADVASQMRWLEMKFSASYTTVAYRLVLVEALVQKLMGGTIVAGLNSFGRQGSSNTRTNADDEATGSASLLGNATDQDILRTSIAQQDAQPFMSPKPEPVRARLDGVLSSSQASDAGDRRTELKQKLVLKVKTWLTRRPSAGDLERL